MLNFEPLESRVLLAGNVTASVSGSTLTITGDAAANSIDLYVNEFGALTITGSSTTVNGGAAYTIANTSGIATINVNLGDGNDTLSSTQWEADLLGVTTFVAEMGTGNDSVSLTGAWVPNANMWVSTGTGNDGVWLTSFDVKQLYVEGLTGTNNIYLNDLRVDALQVTATRPAWAPAETDANHIEIINTATRSQTAFSSITLGAGVDEVLITNNSSFGGSAAGLNIDLGAGNDWVIINNGSSVEGTLNLTGGGGNDLLSAGSASIRKLVSDNGLGDDSWYFYQSVVGDVQIKESTNSALRDAGVDYYWMLSSYFGEFGAAANKLVELGDGNDTVYIASSSDQAFNPGTLTVLGGNGNNQIGLNQYTASTSRFYYVGGTGNDQVSFGQTTLRGVTYSDVAGNNSFSMYATHVLYSVQYNYGLTPGSQNDFVWMLQSGIYGQDGSASNFVFGSAVDKFEMYETSFTNTTNVDTGAGNDTFLAKQSYFAMPYLNVFQGGGNDTLDLNSNTFNVTAGLTFNGGNDADTFKRTGNSTYSGTQPLAPVNYETWA